MKGKRSNRSDVKARAASGKRARRRRVIAARRANRTGRR